MLNRLDPSNPKHSELRSMLRLAGPALFAVGLVFAAIGLISFFSAFSSHQPPRLFWCAFIGFPMIAVGVKITKFAYLGEVTRYMANEVSPVGKDVVNYMVDGTKESVRDIAAAVAEGVRSTNPNTEEPAVEQTAQVKIRCRNCRALNDEAASSAINAARRFNSHACVIGRDSAPRSQLSRLRSRLVHAVADQRRLGTVEESQRPTVVAGLVDLGAGGDFSDRNPRPDSDTSANCWERFVAKTPT
jgi:hypothetical protein